MTPAEAMVRDIVDNRLRLQPRTLHVYRTDPQFHASVEHARMALAVVADVLRRRGFDMNVMAGVLGEAVAELLDDEQLQASDEAVRRLAAEIKRRPSVFVADWP